MFFSDPLGIVVYNDLPDGATCFNRTLARESARSCPATATNSGSNKASMANSAITVTAPSKSSMMASAKTLQNHTKAGATATSVAASVAASRTMALRPTTTQSTTTTRPPPTNLRPQHNSRSTDNFLVYETVDKPAQVGRNLLIFVDFLP